MTAMKILQVCADRGVAPGSTKGAAQHLRGIAAGLIADGHSIETYTTRAVEGPFPTNVQRLDQLTVSRAEQADVIYERYSLGHLGGLEMARRSDSRFVLEVNAPLVDEALSHRPATVMPGDILAEETLLNEADLVITVSGELSRWVARRRAGPIRTIRNGFEPDWFPAKTLRPPSSRRDPTLVFIGHPKPWHGADRLALLLAGLGERGRRPRLLVIGGGPGAADLLVRSAAVGVADQITVTGTLPPDRASRLLMEAAVGLAPYPRQQPFYFCPLKIIDYLAAGLPVVATDQGDIPDLVDDAGFVTDPDDLPAFVDAVESLLVDPELAAALGRRGQRRAHASMTWNDVASATADAIVSIDTASMRL